MRIILRADGNSQIGLGHVMRLLALAEMLQPDFKLFFAVQNPSPALVNLIKNHNIQLIDLPTTANFLAEAAWLKQHILQPTDVLVLDGYNFNTPYQSYIKPLIAKLFCLDDIHIFPFVADVVINPAGGVLATEYQLAPSTQLYTGPDYALLRQPFLEAAASKRNVKKVQRIFINLGGADPQNHTYQILTEISQALPKLQLEVVVGSAYQGLPTLQNFIDQNKSTNINLHQSLSAEHICALMQSCDAAICPPSTVAYEWCCIGGLLFLIRTADNQVNLEKFLLEEKLAFSYAQLLAILSHPALPALIKTQINNQHQYFHGQSRSKWRTLFFKQVLPLWLRLRPATEADCDILFNWINEPEVRKFSINPAPIPREIHISWFRKKILDKNSFIFIAELGDEPVGMIRYDVTENEALLSYLLDINYRGKGLGTALLQAGTQAFIGAATGKAFKISGLVQKNNLASIKAFERAGFYQEAYTNAQHPNLIKFSQNLPQGNGTEHKHERH